LVNNQIQRNAFWNSAAKVQQIFDIGEVLFASCYILPRSKRLIRQNEFFLLFLIASRNKRLIRRDEFFFLLLVGSRHKRRALIAQDWSIPGIIEG
jgi:hypothetical protein